MHDPLISPKYRLSDWKNLEFKKEDDWLKAIEIVEDRIRGRFVTWIDRIASEQFSGFVVIALDCLLLETLNGFMTGKKSAGDCSVYKEFLSIHKHFKLDKDIALSFCTNVRNGLIHDTVTKRKWLIEKTKPHGKIVEKDTEGNFVLNRSLFHAALKSEFEDWLSDLRTGNTKARDNLRKRMNQVCDTHFLT
jgi:hypothetical protein